MCDSVLSGKPKKVGIAIIAFLSTLIVPETSNQL